MYSSSIVLAVLFTLHLHVIRHKYVNLHIFELTTARRGVDLFEVGHTFMEYSLTFCGSSFKYNIPSLSPLPSLHVYILSFCWYKQRSPQTLLSFVTDLRLKFLNKIIN